MNLRKLLKRVFKANTFKFIYYLEDNFNKCSIRLKNKYLQGLINKLEKIKVFDSWEITSNEYEELFNEIIEIQRRNCIEEKKKETIVLIHLLNKLFIRKN